MKLREVLEITFIAGMALVVLGLDHRWGDKQSHLLAWVVVAAALVKTVYYFWESLFHLVQAAAHDQPYHRFLVLMAYNMAQVATSFAIDFYCLRCIDAGNFSGMDPNLSGAELMFECLYFSVLNFSFFGYGDITPAHVPAKIVMLLEVITAFSTVIFLLSDFVSMKDSMRNSHRT